MCKWCQGREASLAEATPQAAQALSAAVIEVDANTINVKESVIFSDSVKTAVFLQ
jgi:hypothetical protein